MTYQPKNLITINKSRKGIGGVKTRVKHKYPEGCFDPEEMRRAYPDNKVTR